MSEPSDALRLCLVTDKTLCGKTGVLATVDAAVAGGATMIQLRDKHASTDERVELAKAISMRLQNLNIPLIINDDVLAANAANAQGAHVGQSDMSAAQARQLLGPDKWLGVSCGSLNELARVDPAIVDYVGLGPVFDTQTKPDHDPAVGYEGLSAMVMASPLPSIAIGGITCEHVAQVLATGVNGIAVISAICGQPEPELATRQLRSFSGACQ